MNIIDMLRAKMDEEHYPTTGDVDLVAAHANMEKGRRQGLIQALGVLGCDEKSELIGYFARQHIRRCPQGAACRHVDALYS